MSLLLYQLLQSQVTVGFHQYHPQLKQVPPETKTTIQLIYLVYNDLLRHNDVPCPLFDAMLRWPAAQDHLLAAGAVLLRARAVVEGRRRTVVGCPVRELHLIRPLAALIALQLFKGVLVAPGHRPRPTSEPTAIVAVRVTPRARVGVLGELEHLAHERLERRCAGGDHTDIDLEAAVAAKLVTDRTRVIHGKVGQRGRNTYTAKNMIESLLNILTISTNDLLP